VGRTESRGRAPPRRGRPPPLLATYYPVVLGRCRARLRSEDDAYEVAHRVIERLARELRSGRTYPLPYSVVVHKVINWKVVEFFSAPRPSALPEHWDAGEFDRAFDDFEGTYDLEELFARVTGRTNVQARSWRPGSLIVDSPSLPIVNHLPACPS
jgi:hypothetical protein